MSNDQQHDGFQDFLKAQQAEEQPGSVLDRPRPFSNPPKGSQLAMIIVFVAAVVIFGALRLSLWISTGR